MAEMEIRKFRRGEEHEIWRLFYNTIHNVNIRDYDNLQVDAFAPDDFDTKVAIQTIRETDPFVAILEGNIVSDAARRSKTAKWL